MSKHHGQTHPTDSHQGTTPSHEGVRTWQDDTHDLGQQAPQHHAQLADVSASDTQLSNVDLSHWDQRSIDWIKGADTPEAKDVQGKDYHQAIEDGKSTPAVDSFLNHESPDVYNHLYHDQYMGRFIQRYGSLTPGQVKKVNHDSVYRDDKVQVQQSVENLENQFAKGPGQVPENDLITADQTMHGKIDTMDNEAHHYLCYLPGTMIRTSNGEQTVESLQVGQQLMTVSGEIKPIRWIGRQDVIFNARDERPVCFKAHSIAPGLPYKDLCVSAAHGVAFWAHVKNWLGRDQAKYVLIRAASLVNHKTIYHMPLRYATLWHVELEGGHDIVIADGMACESFVDHGERHFFSQATSSLTPHKERDCLPRYKKGKYVRSVRDILQRRISTLYPSKKMTSN